MQTPPKPCAFLKSKFRTRQRIGAVDLNSVRAVCYRAVKLDRSIIQNVAYALLEIVSYHVNCPARTPEIHLLDTRKSLICNFLEDFE